MMSVVRPLMRWSAVVLALALAGCDDYPDNWPRVNTGWRGCPAIAGTWQIDFPASGSGADLADSLFGDRAGLADARPPWETMTLSGDPAKELRVALTRSPQGVTDWLAKDAARRAGTGELAPMEAPEAFKPEARWSMEARRVSDADYELRLGRMTTAMKDSAVLLADMHYHCSGGWLTGRRMVPDENGARHLDGEIRFALDSEGGLVAHATHNRLITIGRLCKFGVCIPIPFGRDTNDAWERWAPVKAAKSGNETRPWLGDFERAVEKPMRLDVLDSAQRLDEVRSRLNGLGVSGLTLAGLEPYGGSAVLATLEAASTDTFAAFFRALGDNNGGYRDMDVKSLSHAGDLRRMTVVLGLEPQASQTSSMTISRRVESVLPPGAVLQKVEPNAGGFRITVHTLDDRVARSVEGSLKDSDQFERVQLETLFSDGASHDAVLNVWERSLTPYWRGGSPVR